jgi:hypothetical protein
MRALSSIEVSAAASVFLGIVIHWGKKISAAAGAMNRRGARGGG